MGITKACIERYRNEERASKLNMKYIPQIGYIYSLKKIVEKQVSFS